MSHVIQQTNVTWAVPSEPGRELEPFDPGKKVHDEKALLSSMSRTQ